MRFWNCNQSTILLSIAAGLWKVFLNAAKLRHYNYHTTVMKATKILFIKSLIHQHKLIGCQNPYQLLLSSMRGSSWSCGGVLRRFPGLRGNWVVRDSSLRSTLGFGDYTARTNMEIHVDPFKGTVVFIGAF